MRGRVNDGENRSYKLSRLCAFGYFAFAACIYAPAKLTMTTMLHLLSVMGPTQTEKDLCLLTL